MLPGPVPTFGVVLPSEPLDGLDPATVARHTAVIERGERPAALVLARVETAYVETAWNERHLLGLIPDGHHRLAAYAAANIPARVLLLTRTRTTTSRTRSSPPFNPVPGSTGTRSPSARPPRRSPRSSGTSRRTPACGCTSLCSRAR